jgi:hypothetical protein
MWPHEVSLFVPRRVLTTWDRRLYSVLPVSSSVGELSTAGICRRLTFLADSGISEAYLKIYTSVDFSSDRQHRHSETGCGVLTLPLRSRSAV